MIISLPVIVINDGILAVIRVINHVIRGVNYLIWAAMITVANVRFVICQ